MQGRDLMITVELLLRVDVAMSAELSEVLSNIIQRCVLCEHTLQNELNDWRRQFIAFKVSFKRFHVIVWDLPTRFINTA